MPVDLPVKSQKRTFSLRESLIRAIDEMVENGAAPSKNALVEQAVLREFQEYRRKRRAERWRAAANDPAFMKEVHSLEAALWPADQEALRQGS
jgi:metal-responsive CopG/Arc/MetJ family transcriptional regulator